MANYYSGQKVICTRTFYGIGFTVYKDSIYTILKTGIVFAKNCIYLMEEPPGGAWDIDRDPDLFIPIDPAKYKCAIKDLCKIKIITETSDQSMRELQILENLN